MVLILVIMLLPLVLITATAIKLTSPKKPTLAELEVRSRELEKAAVIGPENLYEDTQRFIDETEAVLHPRPNVWHDALPEHYSRPKYPNRPSDRPRTVTESIERNKEARKAYVEQTYAQCKNCGCLSPLVRGNGCEYCPVCNATVPILSGRPLEKAPLVGTSTWEVGTENADYRLY